MPSKKSSQHPLHPAELDTLQELSQGQILQKLSGDRPDFVQSAQNQAQVGNVSYSELVFSLAQVRLAEDDARCDWKAIIEHKYHVSEKLGRNIGIHVAALDYFTNIKKTLHNPQIVDADSYLSTARNSFTDPLTRAFNRRYFDAELNEQFVRAQSQGLAMSLLMLDVDHFKQFNDEHGHISGDLVLIELVRILHTICSPADIVARFGGEEFAVILPEKDLGIAANMAEHIRDSVAKFHFVRHGQQHTSAVTVSIGISCFNSQVTEATELVSRADQALYQAKRSGRNCWRIFYSESNL